MQCVLGWASADDRTSQDRGDFKQSELHLTTCTLVLRTQRQAAGQASKGSWAHGRPEELDLAGWYRLPVP